jgi:broad specificity phosphatase PhoE
MYPDISHSIEMRIWSQGGNVSASTWLVQWLDWRHGICRPVRLILVRHGQTECNLRDIWHGWDQCDLTEEGVRQARAVAVRLAGETIDAIYSSDSPRALQTARAIAAPHRLEPILDARLRERMAGEFEGMPVTEVIARYPSVWDDRAADYWGWRPPGGETFEDVLARALELLAELRAESDRRTVVLASHMGVTRVLISRLANIPLSDTYAQPFPSTAVSIFSLEGDRVEVEVLNDAAHIEHSP